MRVITLQLQRRIVASLQKAHQCCRAASLAISKPESAISTKLFALLVVHPFGYSNAWVRILVVPIGHLELSTNPSSAAYCIMLLHMYVRVSVCMRVCLCECISDKQHMLLGTCSAKTACKRRSLGDRRNLHASARI